MRVPGSWDSFFDRDTRLAKKSKILLKTWHGHRSMFTALDLFYYLFKAYIMPKASRNRA